NPENIRDHKISANVTNGSSGEDVEEQKRRKRKRKRRQQRDVELPAPITKKTNEIKSSSEIKEKTDMEPSIAKDSSNASMVKSDLDRKEINSSESSPKKKKPIKPRVKASAKKTIEALEKHDNKLAEIGEINKETKMGKKGWWDR
ncbi:MAG: hypothetical protein CBD72_05140, partial [Flavobacteriaceae bacterium TMED212]